MIEIKYFNEAYVQITCEYDEAQDIADLFSFFSPNYNWSPKYQSGIWDGKIRLFDINNCLLPYGLLKKFIGYLKLNEWDYKIDQDLREKLAAVLLNMDKTSDGKKVLKQFHAVRFVKSSKEDFARIEEMAQNAKESVVEHGK